ncbi:MAG: hypothetical protein H6744_19690 [Deltaproteobacteria bacterium]|nr:hypothetical protein [Deltaproteobacteria bacterium]
MWHARCPDNPEFEGELPPVLAVARTAHWFDPCALLAEDARSELRPEARRRQRGGGWVAIDGARLVAAAADSNAAPKTPPRGDATRPDDD